MDRCCFLPEMLCRSLLQHLQLLLALGVCRQFCLASHISGPRVAAESCLQFPLWSCFSEPRYKRCHHALQLSSPVFRALSCCVPKFLITRWFIVVSQPNYASFACALPSSPLGISSTSLICFMYRLITEEQTSVTLWGLLYLTGDWTEFIFGLWKGRSV